ncbi:MAG TPA: Holliday junction DNA helicase RuvB C-terminal domain-containing protein, partial [Erythrobacter sp.]|nr:Holliday junction DNA helicase RuvB C-terminal domain-containing protein [Erythrobacter sp.]
PYLIQLGLIARTARGRMLNDGGWQHLGFTPPSRPQPDMFDGES